GNHESRGHAGIIASGRTRPASSRDREVGAAVGGPRGLVVPGIERPLLPVGDRAQAIGRHAEAREIVARGAGPLLAEREVVLYGSPFVAMPLDHHLGAAVALQPERVLLEHRARL